jgi:hypothetical protein
MTGFPVSKLRKKIVTFSADRVLLFEIDSLAKQLERSRSQTVSLLLRAGLKAGRVTKELTLRVEP